MANPMTFTNMVDAVEAIVRKAKGGSIATLIGYLINMIYLTEVMGSEGQRPFFWLLDHVVNRRSLAPIPVLGISAANPGVFTVASGHGMVAGDLFNVHGVSGMTEINGMQGTVASVDTTTITTDIDTSAFTAWTSGGTIRHSGITLTSTYQKILVAGWSEKSPHMIPITPEQREKDPSFHNRDSAGLPSHYTHLQSISGATQSDKLLWTPGADASYLLRFWGVTTVDRLSGSDYPQLPARFHDLLVTGAVARLAESPNANVGIEKASLWPQLYVAQLEALRKYNTDWWNNIDNNQIVRNFGL